MNTCSSLGGKNCILFKNTERALLGSGDSGGPLFCKGDGGKMKVFGVASFASQGRSQDVHTGFMGYAPVFSPDAQKHIGQWNPQNRPPNANTFQGFDKMMAHYFKTKTLPDWAKAPSSSSYPGSNFGNNRMSPSGSSYQSQYSGSQVPG